MKSSKFIQISIGFEFLSVDRMYYGDGIVLVPYPLFLRSYERLGKSCRKEGVPRGWQYKRMKYRTRNWRLNRVTRCICGIELRFLAFLRDRILSTSGMVDLSGTLITSANNSTYTLRLTRYDWTVNFLL